MAEKAMECLEEALRIREIHYGEEHESCADTMQWIGNLLRKYGNSSDALDYFKFALSIKQKRLSSNDIDVANTLFNTAVLLDDIEKYGLSLVAYKEALRIRKLVLGEINQEVADTLFCRRFVLKPCINCDCNRCGVETDPPKLSHRLHR